jgi:hypothetical protein
MAIGLVTLRRFEEGYEDKGTLTAHDVPPTLFESITIAEWRKNCGGESY